MQMQVDEYRQLDNSVNVNFRRSPEASTDCLLTFRLLQSGQSPTEHYLFALLTKNAGHSSRDRSNSRLTANHPKPKHQ